MLRKLRKATLLALLLSLAFVSVAYAEGDVQVERIRVAGEVTDVDLGASSFGLHGRNGEDFRFRVNARTQFRSPAGSIDGLRDLEPGMLAAVMAIRIGDGWLAHWVVVGDLMDERIQVVGTIVGVGSADGSFSLEKRDGAILLFQTAERTRFRSRDGAINSVEDLEAGMSVAVSAVKLDDGGLLALVVAAGFKDDRPDITRYSGEISGIVPGQGTFNLTTPEGGTYNFKTTDRTRYGSGDGSVNNIHDLKKGMHAQVGALVQEDGQLVALIVFIRATQDRPEIDVRAAGRIVEIGDRSFTLKTLDGRSMIIKVDGDTVYRSRTGEVSGFEDLEVGMNAAVGAKDTGNGYMAIWLAVGASVSDRPTRTTDETPVRPPVDPVGRSSSVGI